MKPRVSDRWVRDAYTRLNRRIFGNKLPRRNVHITFAPDREMGCLLAEVSIDSDEIVMRINSLIRFSRALVMGCLIHEMVHIQYPKAQHGPIFRRALLRAISKSLEWY
jgi:hypothetical protein